MFLHSLSSVPSFTFPPFPSFPFLFPFTPPHPPARLKHLADLTNEDTKRLSLILLYPTPSCLHRLPPAPLHSSADKMVRTCSSVSSSSSSTRREQHSFRPELCEHQLFLKWAERIGALGGGGQWGGGCGWLSVSVSSDPALSKHTHTHIHTHRHTQTHTYTHLDRMKDEAALGVNCHRSGNGKS